MGLSSHLSKQAVGLWEFRLGEQWPPREIPPVLVPAASRGEREASPSTHVQDRPLLVTTKDTFPSFLTFFLFYGERVRAGGGAEGEGEPQAGFCSEQSREDDWISGP